MSEWRECRISDLVDIDVDTYSPKEKWPFVNYLDTGSVIENNIEQIQYLDPKVEKIPSRARRKAKVGSIVYSTVRPNQRHYALIKEVPENFLVSTGFAVLDVKPDVADERFVFSFLTQTDVVNQLQSIAEQGVCTYPALNPSDIGNLTLRVPDLTTQRRIAAVLGALDDKIELNRKMNANLEAMAQALFKSWFVDLEPFGGQMPEGWRTGTLGDFTEMKRGKVITKDSMTPGAIPVVAAGLAPAYYTDKANVSWPSVTISQSGANAGYVWIHFEDIWASDCSYISKTESPYVYLEYLFLKHNDKRIRHMQHGAAQPHIHADDLLPLEFNVPTKEDADKFTELITPMFERMAVAENQNKTLAQLRDTLLPKLMSGELNVDDVKID